MKKDRLQEKFLEELKQMPIVRVACKRSGISHNSVYRWRNEDPHFASLMDDALAEGEDFINDLSESQLLVLIREKQFAAIRFWLTHRHSKYKKQVEETTNDEYDSDQVIQALGLGPDDFKDEKMAETTKKIFDYLRRL